MHTRRTRTGLIALATLLLVAGAVSVTALRGAQVTPGATSSPAPPSVPPAPVRTPLLADLTDTAPLPTSAGLATALTKVLTDAALGPTVAFSVVDVRSGRPLLEVAAATPVLPASTAKLLTAAAALSVLGPEARLTTTVVAGRTPGDVVLTGGGDPTLAGPAAHPGTYPPPAQLRDLARQVRAAGLVVRRVLVDDGLFTGPSTGPSWRPDYVASGNVAPVSALELDEGRIQPGRPARAPDPALAAGRAFAGLLSPSRALPVLRGRGPGDAPVLAKVESPTIGQLVELMLTTSDNDLGEALARQVAIATKGAPTFAGGAAAVTAAVQALLGAQAGGVRLGDGSGLSRLDLVPPAALSRLLALAAAGTSPTLSWLVSGLPVAGFDGTLETRYRLRPEAGAAGLIRAKTGTLEGVSTLAGLTTTREGRLLAFSVAADHVPMGGVSRAERALDAVAAVLAGCGCR